MYQPLNRYHNFFAAAVLLSSFIACRRDKIVDNTAATYIAASEKSVIPAAIEIPTNLPNGNTRVATWYAAGVQQYKAREKGNNNPATFEWVFVAPRAGLYDAANRKRGSHGAGPFWEISAADSIFAQHFSSPKTAPGLSAGSIDWLLLIPKSGTTPTGIFAHVDYIQRIATKGGTAPGKPPTNANETVEVPYEAVYRFTKQNP